jgi:hypothetical protein
MHFICRYTDLYEFKYFKKCAHSLDVCQFIISNINLKLINVFWNKIRVSKRTTTTKQQQQQPQQPPPQQQQQQIISTHYLLSIYS